MTTEGRMPEHDAARQRRIAEILRDRGIPCERIAGSVMEFDGLLADPGWATDQLLMEVAMLADERGLRRRPDEVWAFAPHPALTGSLTVDQLLPMGLRAYHALTSQLRVKQGGFEPT